MYTLNAKRAKEILYEVFPGHSGIQLATSRTQEELVLNFTCFIHFPEITIWNEKEDRHYIRDLYVKFGIVGGNRIGDFEGTRTSLDALEIGTYNHSHISQTGFGLWGRFCTGQSFVRKCLDTPFENEDSFYAFVLSLPNFVEHESLEGKPYKLIKGLRERATQGGNADWTNNPFNDGVSCVSNSDYFQFSFIYETKKEWTHGLTRKELDPLLEIIARTLPKRLTLSNIILHVMEALGSSKAKQISFDTPDLHILTYVEKNAKEKSTSNVILRINGGRIVVKKTGNLTLLKDKNKTKSAEEETVENPCVFVFPKINEDLSVTPVNIPAIKYNLLVKKYAKNKASSVDAKPSLYNAGTAMFKLMALRSIRDFVHNRVSEQREERVNERAFLESFL
jgi:hypothetical protein